MPSDDRYNILSGFLSGAPMRDFITAVAVILIAIIFFLLFPSPSWAGGDPAALFQNKCAVCHGTDGHANTPLGKKQSIPSFASEKVQKCPDAEITDFILNGGRERKASHSFGGRGISQEDAVRLSTYLKQLGKKR